MSLIYSLTSSFSPSYSRESKRDRDGLLTTLAPINNAADTCLVTDFLVPPALRETGYRGVNVIIGALAGRWVSQPQPLVPTSRTQF